MKKLLRMFGFGTALTACGLAFAEWYCNRCHRWHNGRKCPAITLGFACDDNYGCAPYGCFYQDNYACDDDGYDSDDEEYMIRQAIQRRREHHQQSIDKICNSFRHIRNANDCRLVQDALNQRANKLGIRMNQSHFGCMDDGYGCQNYGCIDFYGGDMPMFECNENRYDCNDYGCHDHYNDYGCFDPYGCR